MIELNFKVRVGDVGKETTIKGDTEASVENLINISRGLGLAAPTIREFCEKD